MPNEPIKTKKKSARISGMKGQKEMTTIIKVAKRFPERHSNKFKLKTFGREDEISTFVLAQPGYKKVLGAEGWMTKEDYELGLFSEYGLVEDDVLGHSELDKALKQNASMEQELSELKMKLEKLQGGEKEPA